MKYDYAYSSTARWVDTVGTNMSMSNDRVAIFKYARDNGWDLVAVDDGIYYFKRPIQESA
jgi:hypothetical protein